MRVSVGSDDQIDAFLSLLESDVAEQLNALLVEFPDLMLGSYPRTSDVDYKTMITLESRDREYMLNAAESLVGRLPADAVIRTEDE